MAGNLETAYKVVFEQDMPKQIAINTHAGDKLQANRNAIERNKSNVPNFFPNEYKSNRVFDNVPLAFKLPELVSMFQSVHHFAVTLGKNKADLNYQVDQDSHWNGNPLAMPGSVYGRCSRISRKNSTGFRGTALFNTVVVMADVDNMKALYPESFAACGRDPARAVVPSALFCVRVSARRRCGDGQHVRQPTRPQGTRENSRASVRRDVCDVGARRNDQGSEGWEQAHNQRDL